MWEVGIILSLSLSLCVSVCVQAHVHTQSLPMSGEKEMSITFNLMENYETGRYQGPSCHFYQTETKINFCLLSKHHPLLSFYFYHEILTEIPCRKSTENSSKKEDLQHYFFISPSDLCCVLTLPAQ